MTKFSWHIRKPERKGTVATFAFYENDVEASTIFLTSWAKDFLEVVLVDQLAIEEESW